jgi:hypothetical protein
MNVPDHSGVIDPEHLDIIRRAHWQTAKPSSTSKAASTSTW